MKIWLISGSFKPYYKWNTFNTFSFENEYTEEEKVLNLIINGIPSIHLKRVLSYLLNKFKPYYKWNTFNTECYWFWGEESKSFKPYYKWNTFNTRNGKK